MEQDWTELLRILLAEQDDVQAFMLQCELNRLTRPCTVLRVSAETALLEKAAAFVPTHVILSGDFAKPEKVGTFRGKFPEALILCLAKSPEEAKALLNEGADEWLPASQTRSISALIEARLKGLPKSEIFDNGLSAEQTPPASSADNERPGEKIAAYFRAHARALLEQARHIGRAATEVGTSTKRQLRRWSGALDISDWLARSPAVRKSDHSEMEGNETDRGGSVITQTRQSSDPIYFQDFSPESDEALWDDDQALRDLALSFEILFHATFDALFLLDSAGTILHANAAASHLLSPPANGLAGRRFLEFVPPDDLPRMLAEWKALMVEGNRTGQMRIFRAPDATVQIHFTARANIWFGIHLLVARESQTA